MGIIQLQQPYWRMVREGDAVKFAGTVYEESNPPLPSQVFHNLRLLIDFLDLPC
jgi:hypothetical protein